MKELSTVRELFPIKLVGGFIALDNAVGCAGCSFCLSRRHVLWRHVFEKKIRVANTFTAPIQAFELLNKMLPFYRARVPLRFGHNTDARFQWDFGRELYELLPKEQPFIVMTRFPLEKQDQQWFKGQANLLLKLSLTPNSKSLQVKSDLEAIVASARQVHENNIFYLLGPLVADNVDEAKTIINSLPPSSWLEVKALTKSGIVGMEGVTPASEDSLYELREMAKSRGMIVTDYFGCRMRQALGRLFYKTDDVPSHIYESCQQCRNHAACYAPLERKAAETKLSTLAREIGIEIDEFSWKGARTVCCRTKVPASRGDETYLSEMTDIRILLSTVPEGSEGGSFCLDDEAVLLRWQKFSMLPSDEIRKMARELLSKVESL